MIPTEREGRQELWVIVRQRSERNMKELADHGMKGINADMVEKINVSLSGHVLCLTVTSRPGDAGRYRLQFPAQLYWKETGETSV